MVPAPTLGDKTGPASQKQVRNNDTPTHTLGRCDSWFQTEPDQTEPEYTNNQLQTDNSCQQEVLVDKERSNLLHSIHGSNHSNVIF